MSPQGEQNIRPISDARFATADFDSCDHILSFKSGTYRRDRLVNYHLGCKVNLLRVHVRNSNKICDSGTRCALKKFDLMGRVDFEPTTDVASWQYVGRFTMPDPELTVSRFLYFDILFSDLFSEVCRSPSGNLQFGLSVKRSCTRGGYCCLHSWEA